MAPIAPIAIPKTLREVIAVPSSTEEIPNTRIGLDVMIREAFTGLVASKPLKKSN